MLGWPLLLDHSKSNRSCKKKTGLTSKFPVLYPVQLKTCSFP